MEPMFTNNASEVTRLEGLYISEQNPPAQVAGRSLNGVAVVGECVRGPVNQVVDITSEARFKEVFGGRDYGSGGALKGKVWQALLNKPFGALKVVRAAAADAVAASFTPESAAGGAGTAILRIDAANVGAWGNSVQWSVVAATDGNVNHFDLLIKYLGTIYRLKNLSCYSTDDNLETVVAAMWDSQARLVTLTKLAAGRPVNSAASTDGADADGYTYLGQTVASFASVAGSDGTIADTDFTGTGKGLELIAAVKGASICFVAERSSSALKTKVATLAAARADRLFLITADAYTTAKATAITDAAGFRSDRIVYCFNHFYTLDPEVAAEVVCDPTSLMASILSQTDVDVHPGEQDAKQYAAGVIRLYNENYAREDYVGLREAGIAALEHADDGFAFVSGVTTSLTPGREQITRRRMADYILLGIADFAKYDVDKKNTAARRRARAAAAMAWFRDLAKQERVVDSDEDSGEALAVYDTDKLNTSASRAQGIQRDLMRVKLISHALYLQVVSEIGTGVSITEVAA